MTIRDVTPQDAEAIASIYSGYVSDTTITFELIPPSANEMRQRISMIHPHYPYIVGVNDNNELIGYAYAHPWKEKQAYSGTWESTIYLMDIFTDSGLGKELMRQLISRCRSLCCHALIACITAENTGSIKFHESLGFRRASCFREVGYKFGRYLDVIDFELIL